MVTPVAALDTFPVLSGRIRECAPRPRILAVATARVTPAEGSAFTSEVVELRPNSILLSTDHSMAFRARARIEIGAACLEGEVVFAKGNRLAFTFATTPEVFEAIEALDADETTDDLLRDEPDVLAAIDEALAKYVTAEIRVPPLASPARPPTILGGRLEAGEPIDHLVWCLTLLSDRPLLTSVSGPIETPVILRVLDRDLELEAMPAGAGWMGLRPTNVEEVRSVVREMSDVFARHAEMPIAAPAPPAPVVEASPPEAPLVFEGPLDAGRLLDGHGSSYFDALSRALARRGRWIATVEGDGLGVRMWIDDGRVVFTSTTPALDEDRLGERLVATRRITRSVIEEALAAEESDAPLGATLLRTGRISNVDLNRALREQIIARVARPATMRRGEISIAPWSEPPVDGRLLAVSPGGIRSAVVRHVAKDASTQALRELLEPYAHGAVTVRLERIEPGFRLIEQEMRVLTHAAREPSVLNALLHARGLRPGASAVLVLLGHALGFLSLTRVGTEGPSVSESSTSDLLVRIAQLEEATHFDVLEVHWSASHQEILAAYQNAKAQLKNRNSTSPKAAALIAQLRDRIEEAFHVVGRRTSRARYRSEQFGADERRRAAEHLLEHAELAVLRSDVEAAELALDAAEELAPIPEIARLRQRCRSLRDATM